MKRKLLFAALLAVSLLGAQAQKDVTSTYIKNATLSSLDGWTNVNFNTPVKGNNTTGYASECYAGWGSLEKTEYSLTQKITLPAGNYTLVNYSFFRYGLQADTDASKSLAFMKAGAEEVAIKTLGCITAAGYANSQAEGADAFDSKMYRNTIDFTVETDGTEIEIGLYGTFDLKQSWIIAGMFELIDNDTPATMDSPFDVTGYLTNPGFEYRDMSGWTLSEEGALKAHNGNQAWKVGSWFAEQWQETGALTARSMSQTLEGLPAGFYQFKANVGGDGAYIDLNGKTATWTEDKDYIVGYVLEEGEKLTITAGKNEEGTANWIHFDNLKLLFCGDVAAALTAAAEQVSQFDGKVPVAVYNKLVADVAAQNQSYDEVDDIINAITTINGLYDATDKFVAPFAAFKEVKATADELFAEHTKLKDFVTGEGNNVDNATTIDEITDATAAVKEVVAVYKEWLTLKANADALVAAANDNAAANLDLKNKLDADAGIVANTDNVTTITSSIDDLKSEMAYYAEVANPVGDAQFDLTFMLTNPDVTEFWDGTWNVQPEGWFNDQTGGNFQVMANNDMADGGEVFMEYWSENPTTSGFVLYQKVELTEGTYKMTGRVGLNQNVGGTTANMTFSANETDGTSIAVGKLADQEVEFVNTVQQEVKIGIKAHEGNCYRWIGINKIKLFKLPDAAPVVLDEAATYDYTYAGAATAELTRTISEGFNTIVLPFSLSAAEVEEFLGEGKLYSFTGADLGVLNFSESTSLLPNTPYLFKADAENVLSGVEIAGRTFVAAPAAQVVAAGADYNFVGTYAPLAAGNEVITAADFVLGADKFVIAKGGNALKAFRAFIQANEEVPEVKALTISIDGVATAIEAIDGKVIANGMLYNLAGQRVSKAQKGIFIQNGKKVIK